MVQGGGASWFHTSNPGHSIRRPTGTPVAVVFTRIDLFLFFVFVPELVDVNRLTFRFIEQVSHRHLRVSGFPPVAADMD